jgi:hypothetical protein
MKQYEPGDIRIISIKLTNTNKSASVDIRAQVMSLSIFEDIEEPTIYAELMMVDSINLVKDFPIIGEEDIEIVYVTPGRDKPTKYNFRTYSIDGTVNNATGKGSAYMLKCVSQEHFINSITLVDKGYNNTVAEMVADILVNEIKTKKPVTIETTRGLIPVTLPKMNPLAAVDFLRQKAVSKRASGGVFVFFENQYGVSFVTLEKLIEDGSKSIDSRVFTYNPDTISDKQRKTYAFRNLQRFEHLSKFDTIDKLAGGMYKNTVRSFDLLSKEFGEVSFEMTKQAHKFETGDKATKVPNTQKIMNEVNAGAPFYMFTPKDSSKGNDFVSDLIGYRHAFVKLFNQNVTRCMAYGDSYLTVGDMIQLDLPDTSGTTEKKTNDARYSGKYMITKLRHLITQEDKKFKHNVTFDCNKIGFNA